MASIPTNYPSESTDGEINSVIKELSLEIVNSGGNINTVMQLSPIISLGQTEMQKRILDGNRSVTSELHAEVKRQSESSERNEKASKRISLAAIILSVVSIAISIYFSVQSDRQNKEWQQTQTSLLQQLVGIGNSATQ